MNSDPIIEQRGQELLADLPARGWRVVQRTRDGLDWWAAELWTIESFWTPAGVPGYLTFLVDPMDGEEVWALSATSLRPAYRGDAESGHLIRLRRVWKKNLAAWLNGLDDIRQGDGRPTERFKS